MKSDPAGRSLLLVTLVRFAGLIVVAVGYYFSGAHRQSTTAQIVGIALMLLGSGIILFGPRLLPASNDNNDRGA